MAFAFLMAVLFLLILTIVKIAMAREVVTCRLCSHRFLPPLEWGLPNCDCPRCGCPAEEGRR